MSCCKQKKEYEFCLNSYFFVGFVHFNKFCLNFKIRLSWGFCSFFPKFPIFVNWVYMGVLSFFCTKRLKKFFSEAKKQKITLISLTIYMNISNKWLVTFNTINCCLTSKPSTMNSLSITNI